MHLEKINTVLSHFSFFYINYVIFFQISLIKEATVPLSIVDGIVYCNSKPSSEYGTDRRDLYSINVWLYFYFLHLCWKFLLHCLEEQCVGHTFFDSSWEEFKIQSALGDLLTIEPHSRKRQFSKLLLYHTCWYQPWKAIATNFLKKEKKIKK